MADSGTFAGHVVSRCFSHAGLFALQPFSVVSAHGAAVRQPCRWLPTEAETDAGFARVERCSAWKTDPRAFPPGAGKSRRPRDHPGRVRRNAGTHGSVRANSL